MPVSQPADTLPHSLLIRCLPVLVARVLPGRADVVIAPRLEIHVIVDVRLLVEDAEQPPASPGRRSSTLPAPP
eukprot:m.75152 g.75152  ORF g.75152 m.75152 type:complete len:73 (-) comp7801_c1_seq2:300-518(-)